MGVRQGSWEQKGPGSPDQGSAELLISFPELPGGRIQKGFGGEESEPQARWIASAEGVPGTSSWGIWKD